MKKLSRELSRKKEKLVNKVNDGVNRATTRIKARADLSKKEINEIMLDDKNIKECTSLQEAYESASFRHFFAKMASKIAKEKKLDDDLQNPKFWEDHITFFLCMGKHYLNMPAGKVDHVNLVLRSLRKDKPQHYANIVLKRAVSIKGGKVINKDEPGSYIRNPEGELSTDPIFRKITDFRFIEIPSDFAFRAEIVFDEDAKDWKNTTTNQFLNSYLEEKRQERKKQEEEIRKNQEENRKKQEEEQKRINEKLAPERAEQEKKRQENINNMMIEFNKELKELDISMPRINDLDDILNDPRALKAISYVFSKGPWKDKDMKTIDFWEKNLPLLINNKAGSFDKGALNCIGNHKHLINQFTDMQLAARKSITNNGYSNHHRIIDSDGKYIRQCIYDNIRRL